MYLPRKSNIQEQSTNKNVVTIILKVPLEIKNIINTPILNLFNDNQ